MINFIELLMSEELGLRDFKRNGSGRRRLLSIKFDDCLRNVAIVRVIVSARRQSHLSVRLTKCSEFEHQRCYPMTRRRWRE